MRFNWQNKVGFWRSLARAWTDHNGKLSMTRVIAFFTILPITVTWTWCALRGRELPTNLLALGDTLIYSSFAALGVNSARAVLSKKEDKINEPTTGS